MASPRAHEDRSPLTTFKRKPERAQLRASRRRTRSSTRRLVAHVGISVDGQPFVIPMVFGRDGDRLILHGSVATRLLRALDAGTPVCVTVTLLDALVVVALAVPPLDELPLGRRDRHRPPHPRPRRVPSSAMACVVDHVDARPRGRGPRRRPTPSCVRRRCSSSRSSTPRSRRRTGGPDRGARRPRRSTSGPASSRVDHDVRDRPNPTQASPTNLPHRSRPYRRRRVLATGTGRW